MRGLPSGTVTFCFTDVEGSTRLLHELGAEAYAEALAEHRRVIREACAREGGVEVDTQGDAFFFAFPTAPGALAAAASFTEALASGPIQVRCGLHTGTPHRTSEGYVGADVHRAARIVSAGHGGQVVVSHATAELLEGTTALASLGAHRLKDFEGPVSLYQLGDGSFPPLKTIANSNLPTPASTFLGREDELYEADLLLQGTRLLTIHGPGGAGKTRFSLELARRAREERFSDYSDGVFSCFLASLRDPSLVLATIAQTLSLREEPGRSALDALASHLADKRMLLLVDNLEHLLVVAPELSELLQACPSLTLLVTSRERLRLQGELPYELPPLAEEEGVSLVCERARVEPSSTIRELCRRLEGLPLAIELAAARLSILTPTQLLERLSQRLDLLKGTRDADPRQQTLRATIDWSYDLLTLEEQRLFRALTVFAGGCTLEAAEDVCDADLDSLQGLCDKSLLRFTEGRFWMLETIREFAGEKLGESGEGEAIRGRHAEFFLALAEELEPPPMGGVDQASFERLSDDVDNLRRAIAHLTECREVANTYRLVGSLFRFWSTRGLLSEGRAIAERTLALAGAGRELHSKVLYAASVCAGLQGDFEALRRYAEERLEIARSLGDELSAAVALNDLGLGYYHDDPSVAEALLRESAEAASALHAEAVLVNVTVNRASLHLDRDDYQATLETLEPLPPILERIQDDWTAAGVFCLLGAVHLALGDVTTADDYFQRVLTRAPTGGVESIIGALVGSSVVAARRGDPERAARLLGAVDVRVAEMGIRLDRIELGFAERTADESRRELGDAGFDGAHARGAALTLEQAVSEALRPMSDD